MTDVNKNKTSEQLNFSPIINSNNNNNNNNNNLKSAKTFPVVGIGASAGGMDTFIQVLCQLPIDTDMTYILIQHLDPNHPSLAVEIISHSIKIKIQEASDGVQIEPNNVYLIPPNYNLSINENVLHLEERDSSTTINRSIDYFFHSLSKIKNRKIVGIILSGYGDDGTIGLGEIKANGGITIAQVPSTARFPEMPQNAIKSGVVEFELSPEKIGFKLLEIAKISSNKSTLKESSPKNTAEVIKHSETDAIAETDAVSNKSATKFTTENFTESIFLKILNRLLIKKNIDFSGYKHTTIKRRILRRMIFNKNKSIEDYYKFLEKNHEEIDALYNDILINVTSFYRDKDCFAALEEKVFPKLFNVREGNSTIRIWLAGCSTGEEAYSLAISLFEYREKIGKNVALQFFATDISDVSIQKARIGVYTNENLLNITPEIKRRFFEITDGGYKIRATIRELILFTKHDMTRDPPFSNLDLICCRNILIYFSKILQKKVIPIFHFALKSEGILWLGKSETISENSRLFSIIDNIHKIYLKLKVKIPHNFYLPLKPLDAISNSKTKLRNFAKPTFDFQSEADKIVQDRFIPSGVIINSEFEILQFRGRTIPFLEHSSGLPSLNLLKMIHQELLLELRTAVHKAKINKKSTVSRDLHFEIGTQIGVVKIEVIPLNPYLPPPEQNFLILFIKIEKEENNKKHKSKNSNNFKTNVSTFQNKKQIEKLVKELDEIKTYQKSLFEQYEFNQEELSAANEELQSTNEEFQSTNEEIQMAQEELQSTNEELITVNDELLHRNNDLTILSNDLNNIFSCIEIPILIVGSNFMIRKFSPHSNNSLNLTALNIGRHISEIRPNFDFKLTEAIISVTETLIPLEIEIKDYSGSWLRIQIQPYRTIENKIEGVVVSLIDIDALKKKEYRINSLLEYNTSVAESVQLPLAVLNQEFELQSANSSFYRYFGTTILEIGKNIFSLFMLKDESQNKLKIAFTNVFNQNINFDHLEVESEIPEKGIRKIDLSSRKIKWIGDEQDAILVSFFDFTKQWKLEERQAILLKSEHEARIEADKANFSKDFFLATLSHELRTPLSSILTWSQLISHGRVDFEKAKQGASIIEQSAKNQCQLIDDLLDISRIASGKLTINMIPLNPIKIINLTIETVKSIAEKKQLAFELDLEDKSVFILADPIRLQQILWNLLTNAIKFSPRKNFIKIQFHVVCYGIENVVQIKISDFGNGIPIDFLPNIFKKFSQADSSSTREHGGLGLGLSIVQNLVNLQNGKIIAENSSTNTGAIFTLIFPTIKEEDYRPLDLNKNMQSQLQNEDKFLTSPPDLKGLRILLIDDEENARESICLILKSFHAEVFDVGSVSKAFETLYSFTPDLIISDIAMPIEDGFSLISKLRNLPDEKFIKIPAIALSAYATTIESKLALEKGFQAHIAKPVEASKLAQLILNVMSNKL